jgi:hypothetical protein
VNFANPLGVDVGTRRPIEPPMENLNMRKMLVSLVILLSTLSFAAAPSPAARAAFEKGEAALAAILIQLMIYKQYYNTVWSVVPEIARVLIGLQYITMLILTD